MLHVTVYIINFYSAPGCNKAFYKTINEMKNLFKNKNQNVSFKNALFSLPKPMLMFIQYIQFQLISSGNLLHQELTSFVTDSIKERTQEKPRDWFTLD